MKKSIVLTILLLLLAFLLVVFFSLVHLIFGLPQFEVCTLMLGTFVKWSFLALVVFSIIGLMALIIRTMVGGSFTTTSTGPPPERHHVRQTVNNMPGPL